MAAAVPSGLAMSSLRQPAFTGPHPVSGCGAAARLCAAGAAWPPHPAIAITMARSGSALRTRLLLPAGLALLDLALELAHDVRVAQRRHVAELAALGDVAQQPAHDLARAGLGQVLGPDDPLRPRELADPVGHVLADVGDQRVVAVTATRERHEGGDRLSGVLVRL